MHNLTLISTYFKRYIYLFCKYTKNIHTSKLFFRIYAFHCFFISNWLLHKFSRGVGILLQIKGGCSFVATRVWYYFHRRV